MKKIVLFLLLMTAFAPSIAANADSVAYQLQRQRINNMLTQRSLKFNQYTQSLDQHTGIFGWQTKKDINRSGAILMDIVRTDDDIFKELKVLFDYKNFQQSQVQLQSHESENQIVGYMLTINKLRTKNEMLLKQRDDQERALEGRQTALYIIIVILLLAVISLYSKRNLAKRT